MARTIALMMLVYLTLTSSTLLSQEPLPKNPLDQNAALSYWQAFALLPPIDDETRQRMAAVMRGDASIDEEMEKLVAASENALAFLHRGSTIQPCGWGLAFETGPYAYLPHLGKARELSRMALMRARIRFAEGQVEEAMADTIAAIQLGRHAGQEGVIVLINVLVGFSIESEAIETIVDSLQHLDQQQRDEFEQRINQFQPAKVSDISAAIKGERDVFLGWLIREIESGGSRDRILDLASESAQSDTIARAKRASQDQLRDWAKEMASVYDSVITSISQPEESIANAKKIESQINDQVANNPLAAMFLPAFAPTRLAGKRFVTKRTLLTAAFALFRDGPSALDRDALKDPFGNGPFELRRLDDGAELVSDLKRGDASVSLKIPGLPE